MENWYYAKNIGQLYIEKVLVHGDEPVLFVCVDDNNQRYLCMAYEPEMLRFVMIRISTDQLLDMLENKLSMDRTFRLADEIITTEENADSNSDIDMILTANDSRTFPADHLPKAGAYYNLNFGWVKDYIAQLKDEQTNADIELSLAYFQPFNKSVIDKFNITYKAALEKPTYESLVGSHSDRELSANYKSKVDNQDSYSMNVSINFDNRAA